MLREARRLDPNAANDARSIEVAYGRLLWPFRWINRYVYRWQDAPPKRRWLYFTLLAAVFGFGGLIVGSHGKGVQQSNEVWTPICVFLINYAIAAVTLDYLAASAGAMFLRREFGMRWYVVMWRPIVVAPLVIAHLVGIPIGLLASYEPCVGVMTCELALCFPFLAESVQSSGLRLTGYICLPLMFVLMIDGTIGAITFDYESPVIGLIVLLPFFGITYFADNITRWAGRVAFQRSPLLKENSNH
jgi:hypothetical protein